MADPAQVFGFPLTGDRIILRTSARETRGAYAAYEFVQPRRAQPTFAHFHPTRQEEFEILAGSASYKARGVTHHVHAGAAFTIPTGATHVHPWNTADEPLRFVLTFRPQRPDVQELLDVHAGFALLAQLAREGKLKRDLAPKSLLQAALALHAGMPTVYLASVPVGLQRAIVSALARLAQWRGYRPLYADEAVARS